MLCRPTRVGLLHPCYWPEVKRGSERYIHDLAHALIQRGHQPHVLTAHPARPVKSVDDTVPVTRNWRPPDGWLRRRGFDDYWTHVGFQYWALRQGQFDVAHAFYPTDALAATVWGARSGHPVVFSMMGIPNPLIKIRLDALPRAARKASLLTVDSRAVQSAVFYRYGLESRVVYPGVDLSTFAEGRSRAAAPTVFCPAAIDVARKRVPLLLDAVALVRESVSNVRLVLVRPDDRARAAAVIEAYPFVEFIEPVADPQLLAPHYGQAWATALPSVGEAFGMVVIESLACGTPVVTSDWDAFPEIVDRPEIGRRFAGDQVRSLADSVLEVFELAGERSTREACRSRASDFSIQRTVTAFEQIYDELS